VHHLARSASASTLVFAAAIVALAASACGDDESATRSGSGGSGGSGSGEAGGDGSGGSPSTSGGGEGGEGGGTSSRASAGGDGDGAGGDTGGSGGGADGGGGSAGGEPVLPEGPPCDVDGREGVCADTSLCTVPGYAPVPGHCEGPAEIQCCAPLPDGGECDPEAHPLPNVGIEEPAGMGGCPAGMIDVADFCVDRYEAFLVTYPDEDPVSPYFNPDGESMIARSAPGAVPQGYIDQPQAEDACLAAGKRLCSDDEWLRACQGPDETVYPYGDDREPGVCNDARAQHPAIEYFGTSDDWIWSELGHPCLNQLDDGLATTGQYDGCETFEGAFDMMGNLHEWTSDPAGTFRGGFYVDTEVNGDGCLYRTGAHDVTHWDYSTGFRCCADR
jgi:sulfatase modifying factor 1